MELAYNANSLLTYVIKSMKKSNVPSIERIIGIIPFSKLLVMTIIEKPVRNSSRKSFAIFIWPPVKRGGSQ